MLSKYTKARFLLVASGLTGNIFRMAYYSKESRWVGNGDFRWTIKSTIFSRGSLTRMLQAYIKKLLIWILVGYGASTAQKFREHKPVMSLNSYGL